MAHIEIDDKLRNRLKALAAVRGYKRMNDMVAELVESAEHKQGWFYHDK